MSLRALVPIKRVVDYTVKVRVLADRSGVDKSGVKMSINPFCEIALEEAIRLREKGVCKDVTAVSIGPAKTVDALRTALAMGADSAIHVETNEEIDKIVQPIHVAKMLAAIAAKNTSDVVLMGKQSIDDDYNQTGQMLAVLLGWPMATFISKVESRDGKFFVEREIDGGIQQLELPHNSVLTCDLRLNKPRYPKLPDIMKAKKKAIETLQAASLDIGKVNAIEVLEFAEPAKRKGGVKVASVDELLAKLRSEAKVL